MNFTDSVEGMFESIIAFLPLLLGAILILVLGYIVAKLLEKGTDLILEKAGFDRVMSRGGVEQAIARTGTALDPSSIVARLVFWTVLLVAILMAANALGLTAVSDMFESLVIYIPNVIVAVIILTLAFVLSEFVKDVIMAALGGVSGAEIVARIAKAAIIILAIFMALDQLQIAEDIVTTAFTLLLGALALAAGLAFGLGNRELAGEYTRRWVKRGEERAVEMKREVEVSNDRSARRPESVR